ncbi:MAG: hemin uptake protein HemP [Gemmobacter sp.]
MTDARNTPEKPAEPPRDRVPTVPGTRDRSEPPIYDAADLLSGSNIAVIRLGAQTYRLRLTRQGKLILNK